MEQSRPLIRVIDDNELVLSSIKVLLEAEGWDVSLFRDSQTFLSREDFRRSGCIIAEVRMPYLGGFGLQAELNKMGVDLPMIFLTGYGDHGLVDVAKEMGVRHLLQKHSSLDHLIGAVNDSIQINLKIRAQKNKLVDDYMQKQCDNLELPEFQRRLKLLSPREREVIHLQAQGLSSREVGERLGISSKTVDSNRYHGMTRLGLRRVADLIRLYNKAEILDNNDNNQTVQSKEAKDSEAKQFVKNLQLLSVRQREIIDLIFLGKKIDEIAEQLNLTKNSVNSHRRLAYGKLGIFSATEIVRIYQYAKETLGNMIDAPVNPEKLYAQWEEFNSKLNRLSERERNLVNLIDLGMTINEIAQRLEIKVATVYVYLYHIYIKLGVHGHPDLVLMLKRGKQYNLQQD